MDTTRGLAGGSSRRRMSGRHRAALAVTGLASWLAGGAASFLSGNGAGAAALIAAGAVCVVLSLVGHWPSRISISGNEVSWESVDLAVSSQIEVAIDNDESESVLAELNSLRERLGELQRTGTVPLHPAQIYDDDVASAIRRLLPGATITRQDARDRQVPDFIIRYRSAAIFAETKWRADQTRPFAGSTLPELTRALPPDAKLLVISNTSVQPHPRAYETLRREMGDRGRIVCWIDSADDTQLGEALTALLNSDLVALVNASPRRGRQRQLMP